ncbi:MAG TPA: hypothetical protein VIV54_00725 [Burkholderiales bacterium]
MKKKTILLAAALIQLTFPVQADERIEGSVLDTTVTYCEGGKHASCIGRLTLQRDVDGRRETMTIRVPLGTPISCGADAMFLHRLRGRTVIVTEDARVAKAIETVEAPTSAC